MVAENLSMALLVLAHNIDDVSDGLRGGAATTKEVIIDNGILHVDELQKGLLVFAIVMLVVVIEKIREQHIEFFHAAAAFPA